MTQTVQDLVGVEEIERTRLFRGDVSTRLQRAFGGQVLAQALMAGYATVDDARVAHSMHAYFLRPGATDLPVLYDVNHNRDGGSFSSRTVVARQGGSNIFTSAMSFQDPEDGLEHKDPEPADAPDPETCPPLAAVLSQRSGRARRLWEQEWNVLDVRLANDTRSGMTSTSHAAHLRVWVKATAPLPDEPRWHQAALAYLSDLTLLGVSTVPHGVVLGSPRLQAASLDHSMWFHRPCRADDWILYDQVSPSASGARGFSFGRLFQDGTLVASCAQEGLIRVVDPS